MRARDRAALDSLFEMAYAELRSLARSVRRSFPEDSLEITGLVSETYRIHLAHLFDEHQIIGGYDLGQDYGHLDGHMLLAVTEMNSRDQIDELVEALREIGE